MLKKVNRKTLLMMIENDLDYSLVDVGGIKDFSGIFNKKTVKYDISRWDTSLAENMDQMFKGATCLFPLGNWNVSNVKTMNQMFSGSNYNLPLNNWNVSNVESMISLFFKSNYNSPLNNWCVSKVKNMSAMFFFSVYNHPLEEWDVSSVLEMKHMFSNSRYNHPLDNWDISKVKFFDYMFFKSSYNKSLAQWQVRNARKKIKKMFYESDLMEIPFNLKLFEIIEARYFILTSHSQLEEVKKKTMSSLVVDNQLLELNFQESETLTGLSFNYEEEINLMQIRVILEEETEAKVFYFLNQENHFLNVSKEDAFLIKSL